MIIRVSNCSQPDRQVKCNKTAAPRAGQYIKIRSIQNRLDKGLVVLVESVGKGSDPVYFVSQVKGGE